MRAELFQSFLQKTYLDICGPRLTTPGFIDGDESLKGKSCPRHSIYFRFAKILVATRALIEVELR